MRGGAARALLWPALAAAFAFALLVSLGVWQLRRLDEKETLIARVEARAHLAAKDLPPREEWAALVPADYEFVRVRLSGRYLPGRDALIFMRPPEGYGREPGYMAVTPFALSAGGVVLVERGFVPVSKSDDLAGRAPPAEETEISGLLRAPQTRNPFTPADAPASFVWFTRDPAAIAATLGVSGAAPFTLALEGPASAGPNGFPRPVEATPEFVNNHLSYALTWFGLAATLLVLFVVYARGRPVWEA
ncbi:MAG TPA: SURF1 family protein [Methylocystis sp.]|jgi:surfeit locus 1 family protein